METIKNLLTGDLNFNITIQKSDLLDFANFLISKTKTELEEEIKAARNETYLTRLETSSFLRVDQSTLWRWAKRGVLSPIEVGGKRMYQMSDLTRFLNGGK
jgi:hypothetical protein